MSNARRRKRSSGEPEEEEPEEETETEEAEENKKEDFSQKLFVTLQVQNSDKKPLKSLNKKRCRSLPSSIFEESFSEFDFCTESTMVFDKRGYFYESVGGVFYTLEWPLKSSASSTELDMPPNIETIVQTTSGSQVNKPDQSKCGKSLLIRTIGGISIQTTNVLYRTH